MKSGFGRERPSLPDLWSNRASGSPVCGSEVAMSLRRLIYYSAIVGGWSAFLGWMASEYLLGRVGDDGGRLFVALTCALVGAAIGAGLNLVAGMANARLTQQLK